ncbi:hypothetical protein BH11ACT5_BH11ACT5_21840 [soil metagenome]
MRDLRTLLPAALVAAALWLASALAYRALSGINPGPHQFVEHLTPKNLSPIVWEWAAPWVVLGVVLSMLVLAIAYLLVGRVSYGVGARAPRFLVLWFAAVVAGTAASLPWAIGITLATYPPARPAFLFNAVDDLVLQSAYWGLVWGWVPALVGVRRAWDATRSRRTTTALVGSLVAAIVLASAPFALAVPAGSDELVDIPEAIVPSEPVTPPPTLAPDAGPIDPEWCTPDQSALLWGYHDAATGHRMQTIRLMNFSEGPCVLEGYADLAFADAAGSALDITVTHGGSFMAQDPGPARIVVPAGGYATFSMGWDAGSGADDEQVAAVFGAAYPGYPRGSWPEDPDIFAGQEVTITAWMLDPLNGQDPGPG